jgi:hypothetical protein
MNQSEHTRSFSTVFHVGDLSGERERPHISYEGAGVSVSQHPEVWRDIVRKTGDSTLATGATTYELSNQSATFFEAVPGGPPRESVIEWAFANGFVHEEDGYEVRWQQGDDCHTMQFFDRARAEREAAVADCELHDTMLLALGERGRRYWEHAFKQLPSEADPLVIRGLTPIWYAEAHDYDGVWWNEDLAPANYSAPRGVIFQSRLGEWTVSA